MIDINTKIEIGGIRQRIHIKTEDASKPVLLFLHGGPGVCNRHNIMTAHLDLLDTFTIATWDQRGSGRSWEAGSDPVTPTQLQSDLAELVEWLCAAYDREQVVLVGYSFGTALCLPYAAAHPERVAAYIAVSQVTDLTEAVSLSAERALAHPEVTPSDAAALREGRDALLGDSGDAYAHIMAYRQLQTLCARYFPTGKGGAGNLFWAGAFSPDCGVRGALWKLLQMSPVYISTYGETMQWLFCEFRASAVDSLQVPVLFISGEHDYVTPPDTVAAYAAALSAPSVRHTVLSDCAHSPFFDDPEAFADAIRAFVR
jgi:pimeloyl-ACP methyl ester carboxylesterase